MTAYVPVPCRPPPLSGSPYITLWDFSWYVRTGAGSRSKT